MTPPLYRIFLTNETGDYYVATQNVDGSWAVTTDPTATPLQHLPKGWDDHKIAFKRNMEWMGVFGSLTSDLVFSHDGYGIFRDLYHNSGWIQTKVFITIEKRVDTESSAGALDFWRYETYYESMVNFNEIQFDEEGLTVRVGVLDGELNDLLRSTSGTQFNIPIWEYNGSGWNTNATFIQHQGIKLLWQADYESAASTSSPYDLTGLDILKPFNLGKFIPYSTVSDSRYTLPAMTQKSVIQNNGATTFIGNDILAPFIIVGSQQALRADLSDITFFDNATKGSYVLKSLMQDSSGDGVNITLYFEVTAKFTGNTFSTYDIIARTGGTNLKFGVFEIDANNNPSTYSLGGTTFTYFYDLGTALATDVPGGSTGTTTVSTASLIVTGGDVVVKKGYCYVFALLYDDFSGGGLPNDFGNHYAFCKFDQLSLRVYSKYNSGTGSPVDAPKFPASTVAGFRPERLWRSLVPCLETNSTNAYGFPIVPVSPTYSGDATDLFYYNSLSVIANDVIITSGNNLRMINGQPYITTSIRDFFTFVKHTFGMGLYINGNQLKISPLESLFDISTLILDLGTDIAKLKVYPYSDIAMNNLKVGYDKISTNNDYGVDGFCTEQHYRTVVTREVRDYDAKTPYNAEMYAIEKARVQQNSQPIQSPSADNQTFVIQVANSPDGSFDVYDPSGNLITGVDKYIPLTYPTAQSTDSTAATDPYIRGLYYPDTAINVPLTPSRNAYRFGKYLHTALHGQDGTNLQFQKQYQMLYDNSSVPLPGISTNLQDGYDEIQEVADLPVSQLPDKLFIPTVIEITTKYPVNIYSLISSNPHGYIQGTWRGIVYKGFILEMQIDAKQAATTFKLLATPDMVF